MVNSVSNVASNTSGSQSALGKTVSGSDISNRFLSILVAQLKNQDPLNPLDNAGITSQLAQLSQLEQLTGINQKLSNSQGAGGSDISIGASLIGKKISQGLVLDSNSAVDLSGSSSRIFVDPTTISNLSNNDLSNIKVNIYNASSNELIKSVQLSDSLEIGTYSSKIKVEIVDNQKKLDAGFALNHEFEVKNISIKGGQVLLQNNSANGTIDKILTVA